MLAVRRCTVRTGERSGSAIHFVTRAVSAMPQPWSPRATMTPAPTDAPKASSDSLAYADVKERTVEPRAAVPPEEDSFEVRFGEGGIEHATKGYAEFDFEHGWAFYRPADGDERAARARLGPHGAEPVGAVASDQTHVRAGFSIVDEYRALANSRDAGTV